MKTSRTESRAPGIEAEVAPGPAGLALDKARLDQDLQVMADGSLGEIEEGLELADADGLTIGPQEHVHDPQAMAIGERLDHRLQLGRLPIVEGSSPRAGYSNRSPGAREATAANGTNFIEDHQ